MARPTRQARYPSLPLRGRTAQLEEHFHIRETTRQVKDDHTQCRDQKPAPIRPV